jgi:preprotein translocase subunit SecE
MADKIKLLAAILLMVLGIAGFYLLSGSPTVVRVLSVLVGLSLAVALGYFTVPGKAFYDFTQESVAEARKVVWPTRKETMQMTGLVVLFVLIMALFLWGVDSTLFWVVKLVMGRSE